jgi:hypothetical protein
MGMNADQISDLCHELMDRWGRNANLQLSWELMLRSLLGQLDLSRAATMPANILTTHHTKDAWSHVNIASESGEPGPPKILPDYAGSHIIS